MAADFIRENRKGPWLFSLNCFDPHSPLDPPRKYLDRFDVKSLPGPLFRESDLAAQKRLEAVNFQTKAVKPRKMDARLYQAKYWAQIELIDENVGRLLDVLDQTGQRDNTIVIFTYPPRQSSEALSGQRRMSPSRHRMSRNLLLRYQQ